MKKIYKQIHDKQKIILFILIGVILAIFSLLVFISPAGAQQRESRNIAGSSQNTNSVIDPDLGYNPVQVLVKLAPEPAIRAREKETVRSISRTVFRDRSLQRPQEIRKVFDARNIENHEVSRWFTFDFKTAEEAERFIASSRLNPWVQSVERDVIQSTQIVPQDEFFQEGSPESLWGHDLINVQDLWNVVENPGEGVIVAVVDTGVSNAGDPNNEWTHLDLLGSEWVGSDGTVLGSSPSAIAPVWEDYNGHGTHVAGTIGARANDFGIPGIAFDSTIMAYKLSNGGGWLSSTSAAGIIYAVDNGASIINASFGGVRNSMTDDAVKYAFDNDVLFVAAAGNDYGTNVCKKSPGGSEYAVAVSSVDKNANISSFSNIGTGIDVAAPGGGFTGPGSQHRILSTATKSPNGIGSPVVSSQGEPYTAINGTSMATPHVAAAAAIIRQLRPNWNVEEVWAGLKFISQEPASSVYNQGFGYGLLDMSKILDLPETIPVAQMYEPQNCYSPSEAGVVTIKGSAYVSGSFVPDQIRIEFAQGHSVSDSDFELLTVVNQEVTDDVLYVWDATSYPLGNYTLRVVTEFDGVTVEDRNQISFIQYDYKTALRMSITRILGFDSIMPSSPETSQGYGFAPKSYFNRFLHEYNEETEEFVPLVQYPTGEFNGVINYPNPSPSFTSDNVWYKGFVQSNLATYELEPIPVLSPAQFTQRSLAGFDNSRTDEVYLTYPFLEIGEQKSIHPHEKEVLCHLGFAVEGASEICEQHVPVPVTDFATFSNQSSYLCLVPGLNDFWLGLRLLTNSQGINPGAGSPIIKKILFDNTDTDIAGVQLGAINCPVTLTNPFIGGFISDFSRRTVSFFFNDSVASSKGARYAVMHTDSNYLPETSERRISQDGRIVLWFCENPYNYICNGNFEKGIPSQNIIDSAYYLGNHLLQRLTADNWASMGTADLYVSDIPVSDFPDLGIPSRWWGQNLLIEVPLEVDPYNSRFAGFANTTNISAGSDHREVIFTQLGRSFDIGQEYQIRFDVWSSSVTSSIPGYSEYISDPNIGKHLLYIVGSTDSFNTSSQVLNEDGTVNLSVFDEVFFELDLDEQGAYDEWVTVSTNFTPQTENISYIYILSHSEITDMSAMVATGKTKYSRYTNLDNFIVEPQLPYRDLRVEKEMITSNQTVIGQEVSFEVVVTNDSQESIEEVKVQDYLPQGFVLSSAVSSQGQDYTYSSLENMISWQDITLSGGESVSFTISGSFTVCQAEFRNVAIAYSNLYLDETPENNFVDVYRQGFPFNDEIDNYSGFAGGEMGCVGVISGRVFADNNQNQVQDLGETGIGQIEIGLYKQEQDGTHTLEQTVSSSVQNLGFYSFNPQSMGTYVVSLMTPNMFNITLPDDSEVFLNGSLENYVLSMTNGVSYTDRNFGIMQGRVVEGFVYEDSNVNGVYDFGEALLSGIDVGLFWDEGDGYYTFIDSVLTDNDGLYSFVPDIQYLDADLLLRVYVPGDTNIQAITQPLYSAPVDHPNPVFVENTYSLPAGQPSESPYAFGVIYEDINIVEEVMVRPAGTVYQDVDVSGSFDPFVDVRLGGYTVNLFKKLSDTEYELIAQQESLDSSGFYSFVISLSYGEYYLVIDAQHLENAAVSVPDSQNTTIENSPYHYSFTVDENTPNGLLLPGNDFGFIFDQTDEPTMLIRPSGVVFQDVDADGLYAVSDFPLPGYRVDLYRHLDSGSYELIASEQSGVQGTYAFQIIVPYGQYSLVLHPQHIEDSVLSIPEASLDVIEGSSYYYTFIVDGNPQNSNTSDNNFGFVQEVCYPFDLNGDGVVNAADLGSFLAALGTTESEYDFDGNGIVDHLDLMMMASYLGCSSDIDDAIYKIGGFVFDDLNENGLFDDSNILTERYAGVMGVPVYLYKQNQDGSYNFVSQMNSSPGLAQSWTQVVGSSIVSHPGLTGSYLFEVNQPGNYAITIDPDFINQAGYSITHPNASSQIIGGAHRVHFVTLEPAQSEFVVFLDNNFGLNTCGCWNHFVGSTCLVDSDDLQYFNNVLFGNVCEEGQFCPGDYTQTGQVVNSDLLFFLSHYGCSKANASAFPNYFEETQDIYSYLPQGVDMLSDNFSYNNETGFYERVVVLENSNNASVGEVLTFLPSGVVLHGIKPVGLSLQFVDVLTDSPDYASALPGVYNHVNSRNLFAVQFLPANGSVTLVFRFTEIE